MKQNKLMDAIRDLVTAYNATVDNGSLIDIAEIAAELNGVANFASLGGIDLQFRTDMEGFIVEIIWDVYWEIDYLHEEVKPIRL